MRTRSNIFLIIICLLFCFLNKESLCQWQPNGTSIYYNDGNVGIGVTDPLTKLHIFGPLRLSFLGPLGTERNWELNYDRTGDYFYIDAFGIARQFAIQSLTGNIGIGTTNPGHKLEVNGDLKTYGLISNSADRSGYTLRFSSVGDDNWGIEDKSQPTAKNVNDYYGMGLRILDNGNNEFYIRDYYSGTIRMMFNQGWVGIGTTNPDLNYRLSVNGSIRAKEIKVEVNWSDFVFNKDYHLLSLAELENYIDKNKHLPDIPSQQEVKENGVELGDISAKLLQKIEELTLYVIEQKKEIESLKMENEKIKKTIGK